MFCGVKDITVEAVNGVSTEILLKNVSIDIKNNKITCLIGESGAGKTLLSKVFPALLPENFNVKNGTIIFKGKSMDYNMLKKYRGKKIFYTPQNATASLNPVLKIKNQIKETSKLKNSQVISILKDLGFTEPEAILNSYPFELSGGENQRCLLAMAIILGPQLLILDEPTSGLDYHLQEIFMDLIRRIQKQYGLTILLITHNLLLVKNISDYIYIMSGGSIVEGGESEQIFTNPDHNYTKEIVNLPFS